MGASVVGADNHRPGDRWKKLVGVREARLRSEVKGILYAIVLSEGWPKGWSFAGRMKLADRAGMSLRTLEQYLPLMERAGMVETKHRHHASALRRANSAKFHTEMLELLPLKRTRGRRDTVSKTATDAVLSQEKPQFTRRETAVNAASNRSQRGQETISETSLRTEHSSPEHGVGAIKKHLEKAIYRRELFQLYDNLPRFFEHAKRVEQMIEKAVYHLYLNRGRELDGIPEARLLEAARCRLDGFRDFEAIRDYDRRKRIVVGCVVNAIAEAAVSLLRSSSQEGSP